MHFVIINNTQDANMIIDLRKEPKEVREWVQDAERATGLSGFALIMGAIMDFPTRLKRIVAPVRIPLPRNQQRIPKKNDKMGNILLNSSAKIVNLDLLER